MAETTTDGQIVKHDSLDFPDGDVVLSVTDNVGLQHVFRVDRVFLSRHSKIFAGMFSLPPSSIAVNEQHDGVPLVQLVGDKLDGVADLLNMMYNSA